MFIIFPLEPDVIVLQKPLSLFIFSLIIVFTSLSALFKYSDIFVSRLSNNKVSDKSLSYIPCCA